LDDFTVITFFNSKSIHFTIKIYFEGKIIPRLVGNLVRDGIFTVMTRNPKIDEMRLDGGVPCLDFVNTVPDRFDGSDRDNLNDFSDLIYWARKAGILDKGAFAALEKAGQANEKRAIDFFAEAVDLRDLIYAIFKPIALKQKVRPADMEAFNKLTSKYFPFLEVVFQKDKFKEEWNFPTGHFYAITAPLVKSAHALLLSDTWGRVKECPNCGWLFWDTTKNGKRKWCSMEDCGSSAKALAWYHRQKK